ncbi:MAG: sigma-E factor negative regulatory protein [Lysobacteraceae bacterium]
MSSVSRETDARDVPREQLSAMLDGALSADETKFLLRRMEHDDALADCWERWQFVGDALRGQANRALPADFSRRVGRAIADDLALAAADEASLAVAAHGSARSPLMRWGGGAALAASVALAALIGTRMLSVPDGKSSSSATNTASASVPTPVPTPTIPATPVSTAPIPAAVGVAPQPASLIADAGAAVALAAVVGSDRRSSRPRIIAREQVVAVSSSSQLRTTTVASAAIHGSSPQPQAVNQVTSKPWPRALVPGASANAEVTAGFGGAPAFHPLQPQLVQPQLDPQAPQLAHPVEGTSSPP